MKKLLILTLSIIILSGCSFNSTPAEIISGSSQSDAESNRSTRLEDKISDLEDKIKELESTNQDNTEEVVEEEEPETQEEEKQTLEYNGPNFITIDSPEHNSTQRNEPIIFKGVVSPNTTKIEITAKNYGYVMDRYTLQDFELGDENFTYRAAYKWDNLAFGENNYEFTAHFADKDSKTAQITIYSE